MEFIARLWLRSYFVSVRFAGISRPNLMHDYEIILATETSMFLLSCLYFCWVKVINHRPANAPWTNEGRHETREPLEQLKEEKSEGRCFVTSARFLRLAWVPIVPTGNTMTFLKAHIQCYSVRVVSEHAMSRCLDFSFLTSMCYLSGSHITA